MAARGTRLVKTSPRQRGLVFALTHLAIGRALEELQLAAGGEPSLGGILGHDADLWCRFVVWQTKSEAAIVAAQVRALPCNARREGG